MTPQSDQPPRRFAIGSYRGIALDVAAWDAVGADVDLSCACMFAHEVGPSISGGLLHLDTALSGALLRLRAEGVFRGDEMETMLLSTLPTTIRGRALMIIGLGDPKAWRSDLMENATRYAVNEAMRQGTSSAGFAPGLLDSGLQPTVTSKAGDAMLRGVIRAIDTHHRLFERGLAALPTLRRWTFGAGASHAEAASEQFRRALASTTLQA